MKNLFICYIVDPIAEKIIGSFQSPNESYAKKVYSDFISDENNHVHKDVYMLVSDSTFSVCETYSDIVNDPCIGKFYNFKDVQDENNCDSVKEN